MVPVIWCRWIELGPFWSKGCPGSGAGPRFKFSSCNSCTVARLAALPPRNPAGGEGCPEAAQAWRSSSPAAGRPGSSKSTIVLPTVPNCFMLFHSLTLAPLRKKVVSGAYSASALSPQTVNSTCAEPSCPELSHKMRLRFDRNRPSLFMVIVVFGSASLKMPWTSTIVFAGKDWISAMDVKLNVNPGIELSSAASSIWVFASKVITFTPLSNLGLPALTVPPEK
mmetsp:Transcript_43050/g.108191  ORF Transcript_43050/g.108191 Transcript_43050/m.108191 type:complete len:224 (-) Transcript_43050:469-1140(-)